MNIGRCGRSGRWVAAPPFLPQPCRRYFNNAFYARCRRVTTRVRGWHSVLLRGETTGCHLIQHVPAGGGLRDRTTHAAHVTTSRRTRTFAAVYLMWFMPRTLPTRTHRTPYAHTSLQV